MKKFEEELKSGPVSIGQDIITKEYAYGKGALINYFKDWVSPEDYQNTVASNKAYEKSNLVLSKENAKFVVENIELEKQIIELKSQLAKQQPEIPEVPQFVADWYEVNKNRLELALFLEIKLVLGGEYPHENEFHKWIDEYENKPLETIFAMKRLGYTVKEKLFYLKHKSVLIFDPDSDDSDVDELYLGAGGNFVPYQHLAKIFTQREIDSMETGSYEQIPAEEKHG